MEFRCIDGNIAKYNVVGYCRAKGAFLTHGLAVTHKCHERECPNFIELEERFRQFDKYGRDCVYIEKITNR
jgi:hypothetical protein